MSSWTNTFEERNSFMTFEIRKMETNEEIRGKAYVHWKSWQESYSGLIDQNYLDALTLEKCEAIAYRWPDNILIAKADGNVIGFCGYGQCRDEDVQDAGEIFAIYVLQEYQGRGIGSALMQAALDQLAYDRIVLWVLQGNEKAIRFYQKCGFSFDGCGKDIMLGSAVREVRMRKERDHSMDQMFKEFDFNPKPEKLITEINGRKLPEDYLSFMRGHNGGEGPIGRNNYGCFYRLEELEEVNEEYDVQNSWPGYVVIGSDMGGELWAYHPEKKIYCQIDSSNINDDSYETVSASFEEFLINMDQELEG